MDDEWKWLRNAICDLVEQVMGLGWVVEDQFGFGVFESIFIWREIRLKDMGQASAG